MMNRNLMNRQMFKDGGAAFPDLSGDGKVTQKDILIGRGVVPMQEGGMAFPPGDPTPNIPMSLTPEEQERRRQEYEMQKNEEIIRQRIKEAEEKERSFIERMKDYYFGPEKEQDIRDESDAVPMQEGGMAMPPQGMMPAAPPAAMPEMAQAQQAGMDPAILEQMLSQASQGIMALDEAEDYEQVMNSMRETDATVEERRMELADIVGEQDAQQTPESVLTLVQPVMMMAKVDEGVGSLAQGEMTEPVTGDMAGGIMSTVNMGAEEGPAPVNFNQGGVVGMRMGGDPFTAPPANMLKSPLQQEYELQRNFYGQLLDKDAQTRALQGQQDLTQAQMLFDLAQTGLAIAAPGPQRMSLAEKLAYAAQQTELFPKIGARAADLGKFKQEQEQESRKFDLAAAQGAMDLRNLGIQEGYAIEKERIKKEADIEKERVKQEAQAARDKSKSAEDFKQNLVIMGLELQTKPIRDKLIDQDTGLELAYEVRSSVNINPENPYLSTVETNYIIPKMNGKPIVKGVGDIDVQYFSDVDGNKQMYVRNKNVPGSEFAPFLINGEPVYSDLAKLQWQEGVDDSGLPSLNLVNTTTGKIEKRHQKRPELEYRTIKSGNKDVIVAINKETGEHVGTPFTGSANFDYITMGDNLLKLDPTSGEAESIYTAPGSPVIKDIGDGRLAFVYNPTKDNPNGRTVPVHGSVPKAKNYKYETWIDPETSETLTLFSVNDGRERYYADLTSPDGSAVQLNPTEMSRLTRISDDTAYNAAIDLNAAQQLREEYLEALMDQYGGKLQQEDLGQVVNEIHGEVLSKMRPEERQKYRENKIDELEKLRDEYNVYSDLAKDIRNGTGFFNKLKVLAGTGVSMFGGNLWKKNIDANSAVRAISLSLRMAAANSPRLAEGEQVRLAKIMADADRWFTSGDIELSKARVLRRNIDEEYIYVLNQLKNKKSLSAPVVTALEQSKQALQQARRVMEVIVPYGQERVQRSTQLKGAIEGAKEEQRRQ